MLNKKHYEVISLIIQGITVRHLTVEAHSIFEVPKRVIDHQELVDTLAGYFARDNPRFDKEKFVKACQPKI